VQFNGSKISEDLKKEIRNEIAANLILDPETITINSIDITLNDLSFNLREVEKMTLIKALSISSGNISKTASLLGITRRTVYSLIKKYSIEKFLNTYDK
jgi:two-component system NtrC family response regulator